MPSSSAHARTIYLIWKANGALRALIDQFGRGRGVTLSKYTILWLLRGRDPLSSADVARRLGISPQSTNEVVSTLEAAGYIQKQQVGNNRKALRLILTPAGLAQLEDAESVIDAAEADIFEGFTPVEIDIFRRVLTQVAAKGQGVSSS
jgi:DNA-binding MarR family transcriptional regulator